MSDTDEDVKRKEALKEMIRKLHEGADPEELKEEFKEAVKDTTPADIARAEQELIEEGMEKEEITRLCDVHLAVFKESLEEEKVLAPPGHPINTLMEEHKMMLFFAGELKNNSDEIGASEDFDSVSDNMKHLDHIVEHLKESEKHYLREENVLFPYLEKHGITQPPAIMWSEHDKIREIKKGLYQLYDSHKEMAFRDFATQLDSIACTLTEMFSSHFHKENNILFPTGLQVIEEAEWTDISKQFDEVGYCCFYPEPGKPAVEVEEEPAPTVAAEGDVAFETGTLSKEVLEAMLDTLPVDVTFVDTEDTVRYFSQSPERIFVRTKAVIGRTVQQCHPEKSVHRVNEILEGFKKGTLDKADFWINLNERLIYIRYFPVRNKSGEYLGCLEVTQDITDVKKIEGEKRLL
jgi:PAS domain S-box-containing protein